MKYITIEQAQATYNCIAQAFEGRTVSLPSINMRDTFGTRSRMDVDTLTAEISRRIKASV